MSSRDAVGWEYRESVAVILSGGASERFSGQPKALLPIGDEPALVRILRITNELGCARRVVVVGPHREPIERALGPNDAEIVVNPEWKDGRTGSVQRGLERTGPGSDVLLWPVDHPFVEAKTLRTLADAVRGDRLAVWYIPTFRGRGGHPVLLRPPAMEAVRSLRRSTPLRTVLPRLGPQVRRLEVDDPGVVDNVDTPEGYQAALASWKSRTGRN